MSVLGIVGLGLIGGSMALGYKVASIENRIVAMDVDPEALDYALDRGIIDSAVDSIAELTQVADIICLCTPVKQLASIIPALSDYQGVVTDVGSVKGPLIEATEELWGGLPGNWVPGHPIAGSEQHSVRAAKADLFANHKTILTPIDGVNPQCLDEVKALWQSLGAEVITMTVAHHDDVLAQTSHLPHLLAYTLVDVLAGFGDEREVFEYAAGGFRDFSRIAASDPEMWHDIFLTNKTALLQRLKTMIAALDDTASMIENGDSDALMVKLSRAKAARDYFADLQQADRKLP